MPKKKPQKGSGFTKGVSDRRYRGRYLKMEFEDKRNKTKQFKISN